MIAFDVWLNRKKLVRAGVGSEGVLTTVTSWVRRRAPESNGTRSRWDRDLSFKVVGYRSAKGQIAEHLYWEDVRLKPGDVLTIKVVNTPTADQPRRRIPEDAKLVERSQRRVYQRLKRKFENSKSR